MDQQPFIRLSPRKKYVTIFCALAMFPAIAMIPVFAMGVARPLLLQGMGAMRYYAVTACLPNAVSAVFTCVGGALGDRWGRRNAAVAGFALSALALGASFLFAQKSLFAGFFAAFVICTAANGLVSGTMYAIIADVTAPGERPKWMALTATSYTFAAFAGPLLGGYVSDRMAPEYILLFNIPFCVLLALLLGLNFENRAAGARSRMDLMGILLLTLCLVPLLTLLSLGGNSIAWLSVPGLLLGAAAATGGVLLFRWELKKAEAPVLPLSLFRYGSYAKAIYVYLLLGSFTAVSSAYVPLMAQKGLGVSATVSGFISAPKAAFAFLLPAFVGRWLVKPGNMLLRAKRAMLLAICICVSGFLFCLFLAHTPLGVVSLFMAVTAGGIFDTLYKSVRQPFMQAEIPPEKAGISQSTYVTMGYLGAALFGGVYGAILGACENDIYAAFPAMMLLSAALGTVALLVARSIRTDL
ncbi:MAG TPA: MFS transporter [Clostridia bacterium]|nr:MFS transporter [Clostridia bacterium]HPK15353.1 MFS transporter [Clostridia bacterium]